MSLPLPRTRNVFFSTFNALVLLVGVFYLGWDAKVIVLAFFFETIVIGFFHVFKMLIAGNPKNNDETVKVDLANEKNYKTAFSLTLLFIFHYFFFIFVQSVFVFSFIADDEPTLIEEPFNVPYNYWKFMQMPSFQEIFLWMFIYHAVLFVFKFLLSGEYKEKTAKQMFFEPYSRIFIQQFVAIFSGFLILLIGGGKSLALITILMRLVADFFAQDKGKFFWRGSK